MTSKTIVGACILGMTGIFGAAAMYVHSKGKKERTERAATIKRNTEACAQKIVTTADGRTIGMRYTASTRKCQLTLTAPLG